MNAINAIIRALIASFFLFSSFAVNAQTKVERWYQIGYDYSQQQRNDEAFYWMLKAAQAGHIAAQNNIGLSYLHGLGVKKDERTAFLWFEQAAKQGLDYAQNELAMLYYNGTGTDKSEDKAYEWWLKAARQNDEYAQFNLASLLFERGEKLKALNWFAKAKKNNHPQAALAIEEIKAIK